ncbi:MAG: polyphosphate kinase 2 family protein [Burkholderiales bacterium]
MKSALIISRPDQSLRLAKIDPEATGDYKSKDQAKAQLKKLHEEFAVLQEKLYAEGKQSLLIIFQAMDTGGKDGAIQNLFEGIDPSGLRITAFKAPTSQELKHDFLWRVHKAAPAKGMIGVWNRSHYEDVLIVRVKNLVEKNVWSARYEAINNFEKLLAENGVVWLKFYLHISKDEQKKRLQARLEDPEKLWKFNPGDLPERALWDDYQAAYEDAVNRCTTEWAPWHIVPANQKWARDAAVLEVVVSALEKMAPRFPKPAFDPKTIVIE